MMIRKVLAGTLLVICLFSALAAAATGTSVGALTAQQITSLTPATGTLTIDSTPSGAAVLVDGQARGTTPATISSIPAGDHVVTLTLTGYDTQSMTVTVAAGSTVHFSFTLAASAPKGSLPVNGSSRTGSLNVNSIPPGASVTLDGVLKGTTPFSLTGVAAGDHTVTLTKTGYKGLTITATVPAGGEFHESYTMVANELTITSEPGGASVAVDGTLKGTTPLTITAIDAGTHSIVLRLVGYADYTGSIRVEPGTLVTGNYILAPVDTTTPVSPGTTTRALPVTIKITPSATNTTIPVMPVRNQTVAPVTQPDCNRQIVKSGQLSTAPDGSLNCTTVITSDDSILDMTISGGTKVMDPAQKAVSAISVTRLPSSDIPATGPDQAWSAMHVYRCLPEGATFDPPLAITITLSREEWDHSDPATLVIRETSGNGQGWESLRTTADPSTRTFSAEVRHFSSIGIFSPAPAAANTSTVNLSGEAAVPVRPPLPSSPYIPDRFAPVAAVAAGVSVSICGTLISGNPFFTRLSAKIAELFKNFMSSEASGLMSSTEISSRGIRPAENLSQVIFGLSGREIMVTGITALGFAAAFILQDRLEIKIATLVIFLCTGAIAQILHDLAHKYAAYHFGSITEYQFWSIGAITMLATAWFFGNAFAKPSRTVIRSRRELTPEENALVRLAGPLMSMLVAIVSLLLIPLGGLWALAGTTGFSMNLLNSVFSLVPVKPNDGVEIFTWNKAAWAVIFFPMIAFYLVFYVQ
jgi:Zn-dependent protease